MLRLVPSLSYQARREVVERVAPRYHEASCAQKGMLLDTVVGATGYARKYAIGLLNEEPAGKVTILRPRQPRYGSEVQQALVYAWKISKRICAKRLIPFLPTLVEALERHGHLQLSQENRRKLLSMSVATAERLLLSQPTPTSPGIGATKAGTLLKQQIPIHTFQEWDERRPGFLEADLVAHEGGHNEGSYLYTLTLTDVATGWTECLPSPEAVLTALQHAQRLFPFPILGLDTDNGTEFINHVILAWCEREHITFTRGRPDIKNDQCYAEQKNGAIVRHFVGYDRFTGQQAYRQLRELYRGLRLYVNCFQPSMKLQSKHVDGQQVRRVYDAAKTPLQRLLHSGILPTDQQHVVREAAYALDPLDLSEQVEQLQKALLHYAVDSLLAPTGAPASRILLFSSEHTLGRLVPAPASETITDVSERPALLQKLQDGTGLLDWPRSTRDPFRGEWERILSLLLAHPEYSGGDIFQELQRVLPGRYVPCHLTTLQLGIRKIRARLLATMEEPWPREVIQAPRLDPIVSKSETQEAERLPETMPLAVASPHQEQDSTQGVMEQHTAEEEISRPPMHAIPTANEVTEQLSIEGSQTSQSLEICNSIMTIDVAIQTYLQDQRERGRRPKTVEWHQTALQLFQYYLVNEHHLVYLSQITGKEVDDWLEYLGSQPTRMGKLRGANTIATYARSVRAFGNWVVQQGYLKQTPVVKGALPRGSTQHIQLIEPDLFERLLHVCGPPEENNGPVSWAALRNRAILWVLRATGIRVSELCGLRLPDVDAERGMLRVQARSQERWITLPLEGRHYLLCYLDQCCPKERDLSRGTSREDHLFLSEMYRPLIPNTITLFFCRLKKRAGILEKRVSPSALRDTFAVEYLRAGGEPETLRDILGRANRRAIKRYEHLVDQGVKREKRKEPAEDDPSRRTPAPRKKKRGPRRLSLATLRKRMQRGTSESDGSIGKESVTFADDDP